MPSLRDLLRQEEGAAVLIFALALPALFSAVLFAVDLAALAALRSELQGVADGAALAGAKELHLYRTDYHRVEESTRERTLAVIDQKGGGAGKPAVEVVVDPESGVVRVTAEASPVTMILDQRIAATAVAQAFGTTRLCVLALSRTARSAVQAERLATVDAAECGVQSNSGRPDGIDVGPLSRIVARSICSAGGAAGAESAYSPAAQTDCPVIDDPLAGQALPDPGPCDYKNMKIVLPRTISPGHYCGGLTLGPSALVTARPGNYVISGGPLTVGAAASLIGDGVSFRFVDQKSTFSFGVGSIVRLKAPADGPIAGYLFYQDPGLPAGLPFLIATDLATELLGTIYLPSGTLKIDVVGLVAAQSAYTVVVADRLDVKGAHFVINSDYGATDVPVPDGVGSMAGGVTLNE